MFSESQNVWMEWYTLLVMLELLWRPIPELLSVLDVDGAAVYTLGDAENTVASHSSATVHA